MREHSYGLAKQITGVTFRGGLFRGVLAGSLFAGHPPDRAGGQAAVSRAMSCGNTVGRSRHGARL